MSEPAKVFENTVIPGQWHVEGSDDNGRREVEVFVGPTARRQALRTLCRGMAISAKCTRKRLDEARVIIPDGCRHARAPGKPNPRQAASPWDRAAGFADAGVPRATPPTAKSP